MRITTIITAVAITVAVRGAGYADEPHKQFEHDMMARFHMHESYSLYAAVERLLIRGKLDDARDLARAIGVVADEAGLQAWAPQSAAVRERAVALSNATSVDEACRRMARLAEACAHCHVAANAVPEFRGPPELPPDRPTVDARMARHLWAIERVREGMIGAAEEPWRAGLDVLATAPLPWATTEGDRAALANRVHELADRARHRGAGDTGEERTRTYGELLVTCAACHTDKRP